MKTKITSLMLAVFFLMGSMANSFAQQVKDDEENGHPNFTYIDDFEEGVSLWWTPEGSGSTTGIILEDDEGELVTYREHETEIVNPHTGSTGSMKLQILWDNDVEYVGTPSHLVRQHMPTANTNIPERQFHPGQALEVFLYGDGSGNRFRFMVRDGLNTLEGSTWYSIDWTGWKRITWDYNNPDNVVGWVNGDGVMDEGNPFFFDSFQITKDADGSATGTTLYFDDFRIVDPFNVEFDIAGADGSEVISIDNVTYEAGETDFMFFPGEYQYFVQKDGFITATGTFEVDEEDVVINVTLDSGDDPEYTVTFTVMDEEGFDMITDATITLNGETYAAGEYEFELTPGFYNYVVSKALYFDTEGTFTVIDNNVFVNVNLIEIPDVYDNLILSWDVAATGGQSQFRDEYYSVWVAHVENADDPFDAADYEMIFEETLDPTNPAWQYQHREIEISHLQQQNIRIAFRHHNSTNKDRVVIDNVRLIGTEDTEEGYEVVFAQDFEGGLPDGFDPEDQDMEYDAAWLPEGWEAIDANEDGFNWHFGIRIEQDLSYKTYMASQSYDSEDGALTPDNWLITPIIEMPMVLYHAVSFNVEDENGMALNEAVITFDGVTYDAGHFTFSVTNGTYDYLITLDEYEPVEGTVTVAGEDVEVDVVMMPVLYFNVTFSVNMTQADGFIPGETDVYITGTFPGWEFAEPGTFEDQKMDPTDNVFIFTKTLVMPAGTYYYKYFDGPSYNNGEWPGDPNRQVVITDDKLVEDIFGQYVSVPATDLSAINIFPNPANQRVNITSPVQIQEVAIFNIAGQQVYRQSVSTDNLTLSLNGFHNGIYMVRLVTAEGVRTYKLQVAK